VRLVSSTGTGNQDRLLGGREYQKCVCGGQEWRLEDLVMRRAKRVWEVLKGLEYMLKKCVFTMLAIRYCLYPKPRT